MATGGGRVLIWAVTPCWKTASNWRTGRELEEKAARFDGSKPGFYGQVAYIISSSEGSSSATWLDAILNTVIGKCLLGGSVLLLHTF